MQNDMTQSNKGLAQASASPTEEEVGNAMLADMTIALGVFVLKNGGQPVVIDVPTEAARMEGMRLSLDMDGNTGVLVVSLVPA